MIRSAWLRNPQGCKIPVRINCINFLPVALLLLAGAVLLPSCMSVGFHELTDGPGLPPELPAAPAPDPEAGFSYWDDNGSSEPLRVSIDLSEQAAYIYRGGHLVGRSRVATGRSGYSTPTGSFSIQNKQREKRSNLYGRILAADGSVVNSDADARRDRVPSGGRFVGASMPYWMRLTSSGVGMHAGPIPNPGRPVSHGCIRLPRFMAQKLFASAPAGTSVEIHP